MATVQITEYAGVETAAGEIVQVPTWPPIAQHILDCSSGAAASTALQATTRLVRVAAVGGAVHVRLGVSGLTPADAVTASNEYVADNTVEYRPIPARAAGSWVIYGLSA